MPKKGIKRKLKVVLDNVNKSIEDNRDENSRYSRGLSVEGYSGGYRDALLDVMLALDGIEPNTRFWK